MAIEINSSPDRIHSVYNQIVWDVTSDRLGTFTGFITSVTNNAGKCRFNSVLSSVLKDKDTVTLSGFTEESYNIVANVIGDGATTYFDTDIPFVSSDSGQFSRLNANAKIKCQVIVSGSPKGELLVLPDVQNDFVFDISGIVKPFVTFDPLTLGFFFNVVDKPLITSKSFVQWHVVFTEIWDDADGIPIEIESWDSSGLVNNDLINNNVSSGTSTSVTVNKLVDAAADFNAEGVQVGQLVTNTSDNTYARVNAIDSGTQLDLTADIFTATSKGYKIRHWQANDNNWVYNNLNNTLQHLAGSTGALLITLPDMLENVTYHLQFTISNRTAGFVDVSLGGSTDPLLPVVNENRTYKMSATNINDILFFTPSSDFDGEISVTSVEVTTQYRAVNTILEENREGDLDDYFMTTSFGLFLNDVDDISHYATAIGYDGYLQLDFLYPNNTLDVKAVAKGYKFDGTNPVNATTSAFTITDVRGSISIPIRNVDIFGQADYYEVYLENENSQQISEKFLFLAENFGAKTNYDTHIHWVNRRGGISSRAMFANPGRIIQGTKRLYERGKNIPKDAYSIANPSVRAISTMHQNSFQMGSGPVTREEAIYMEDIFSSPIAFYKEGIYSIDPIDYRPVIINNVENAVSDFEDRVAEFVVTAKLADKAKGHQI